MLFIFFQKKHENEQTLTVELGNSRVIKTKCHKRNTYNKNNHRETRAMRQHNHDKTTFETTDQLQTGNTSHLKQKTHLRDKTKTSTRGQKQSHQRVSGQEVTNFIPSTCLL